MALRQVTLARQRGERIAPHGTPPPPSPFPDSRILVSNSFALLFSCRSDLGVLQELLSSPCF